MEIQTSLNKKGLNQIKLWDPTHKTLLLKKEWIKLFKEHDYEGDFYFKINLKMKILLIGGAGYVAQCSQKTFRK